MVQDGTANQSGASGLMDGLPVRDDKLDGVSVATAEPLTDRQVELLAGAIVAFLERGEFLREQRLLRQQKRLARKVVVDGQTVEVETK